MQLGMNRPWREAPPPEWSANERFGPAPWLTWSLPPEGLAGASCHLLRAAERAVQVRSHGLPSVLRAQDGGVRDRPQRLGRHHAGAAGDLLQRPLGRPHRGRSHHGGGLQGRSEQDLCSLRTSQLQLLHRGRALRPPGGLLLLPGPPQQAQGVHGPLNTTPPSPPGGGPCGFLPLLLVFISFGLLFPSHSHTLRPQDSALALVKMWGGGRKYVILLVPSDCFECREGNFAGWLAGIREPLKTFLTLALCVSPPHGLCNSAEKEPGPLLPPTSSNPPPPLPDSVLPANVISSLSSPKSPKEWHVFCCQFGLAEPGLPYFVNTVLLTLSLPFALPGGSRCIGNNECRHTHACPWEPLARCAPLSAEELPWGFRFTQQFKGWSASVPTSVVFCISVSCVNPNSCWLRGMVWRVFGGEDQGPPVWASFQAAARTCSCLGVPSGAEVPRK